MAALQVAGGDVVGDGVAEHVLVGPLLGDVAARLADHNRQLDLVVEQLGQALIQPHRGPRSVDGGGRLGEELRNLRQLDLGGAREARALLDVVDVVAPHAEDVLAGARDRGQQLHGGGQVDVLVRDELAGGAQARLAGLDQREDRAEGRGQVGDVAFAQPDPRQRLAVPFEGDELHDRLPPVRREP